MKIDHLSVEHFRNIRKIEIFPCDTVNVIYGENAQGKTNLLEAMWLFTGCRSFRGAKEKEFIPVDFSGQKETEKNDSVLSIDYTDGKAAHTSSITIGENKKVILDGVEQNSVNALFGEFYGIVFAPSHLSLVKGGPSERRRFLNQALCQLRPKYERVLTDYGRILEQRNALLKDIPHHSELLDTLEIWDDRLAEYSAIITIQRTRYLAEMVPLIQDIYRGISRDRESIELFYESSVDFKDKTTEELKKAYSDALKAAHGEDIKNGVTSIGPHRDDLSIVLDKIPVKNYGSQGQQRSCALSMKLAEAAVIRKITGKQPVAFLDDVMSELDESRQDYILNHIDGWQVFITCCDPSSVLRSKTGKIFEIKGGSLCSSI